MVFITTLQLVAEWAHPGDATLADPLYDKS